MSFFIFKLSRLTVLVAKPDKNANKTVLCWEFVQLAHLFAKLPQPGDSEGTFAVFELSDR